MAISAGNGDLFNPSLMEPTGAFMGLAEVFSALKESKVFVICRMRAT